MCLASLSTSKCYHVLNRIQINYYIHSSHRFVTRQANGIRRNEPTHNPGTWGNWDHPHFQMDFMFHKSRHYTELLLFFFHLQAIRKHNVYAEVSYDCQSVGLFPYTTNRNYVHFISLHSSNPKDKSREKSDSGKKESSEQFLIKFTQKFYRNKKFYKSIAVRLSLFQKYGHRHTK